MGGRRACAYVPLCIQLHMFRTSANSSYIDNRIVRGILHLSMSCAATCGRISSVTGCGYSHLRATFSCFIYLLALILYARTREPHASENASVCLTANCRISRLCLGGGSRTPQKPLEKASRHSVDTQSPLSRHSVATTVATRKNSSRHQFLDKRL